jgi:hypothetical protein
LITLINYIYHAMAIYIAGVLIWLFIKEKKDWQRSLLYLVAVIPLLVRVLRLR